MRKQSDAKLMVKLEKFATLNLNASDSLRDPPIICYDWLDIQMFGWGRDKKSAKQDLLECLKQYFKHLVENKDSLGVIPTHDLEVLHKFFNW